MRGRLDFALKMTAAAVTTALILCSCGKIPGAAGVTKKADYAYSGNAGSELPPENDNPMSSESNEDTQTQTQTQTTAPPQTTAEETTTAPRKPVTLKTELLDGHSFTTANMPKKVYSNTKIKKALKKIDEICGEYGYSIGFVYKNMDTGATVSYNENSRYALCSTIKAPFCKSLLDDGIDLDEKVNISVIWDNDGGKVASGGLGKEYTARQLIKLAITQSDNTAYYNLVNRYGYADFNSMNYELGAGYELGPGWIFTFATANDLAAQYEDIYRYAEKSKRGKWLVKLMTKTDVEGQITAQLADKYTVAHKYGSDWDQNCYHDCAICYADSPFVLVIMTNQVPETEQSNKVFKRLAKQFDIINDQLVVE